MTGTSIGPRTRWLVAMVSAAAIGAAVPAIAGADGAQTTTSTAPGATIPTQTTTSTARATTIPAQTTTTSVPATTIPAQTTPAPADAHTPSAPPAPTLTDGAAPAVASELTTIARPARAHRRRHRHRTRLVARAAAAASIGIKDFAFGPASVTVHVGDTVTWTNTGPSSHTATARDGSFDTGTLRRGASASHTFTRAGTFAYICSIHPFMKGTVTVLAASTASTPASTTPVTTTAASGTPPATPASPAPGPNTLPITGFDAWLAAALGAGLLATGFGVRRRTRHGTRTGGGDAGRR